MQDLPNYGEVHGEAVYVLTKRNALRIPPPPPMKNHGNWIFSLSQLGRYLAEKAEEGGTMILPETAAQKLLVDHGRVVGVRTGDKGRGREGQELPNFEPGADLVAKVTVLAEGTQGHLTGVAIDRFGLRGNEPQVWELGVKEVWKVAKPLKNIVHTMGWPLRGGAKYREFGGSFIYPLGEDMVTIGLVVGLDYRDSELSVHDLLQELKTHPKIRKILEGGERLEWGAKTIPSGGFHSLPSKLHAPGLLLCGDGAGMVNIPRLKGVHYAIESGRLAAEAAYRALQRGETPATALASYDDAIRESFIWKDLKEVRDMRQVFQRGFVVGGALRERDDRLEGPAQRREEAGGTRRRRVAHHDEPRRELSRARREAHVRQALVGLRVGEQDARRPAKPHPHRAESVRRRRADVGRDVPRARLRGRRRGGRRHRHARGRAVELRPVRRDHREGRPSDAARGRLRARNTRAPERRKSRFTGALPRTTARLTHNEVMRNRRFLLLAADPRGAQHLALDRAAGARACSASWSRSLFGKSMVRAQVLNTSGVTWHVDRGVVVSNSPGRSRCARPTRRFRRSRSSPSATKVTAGGAAIKLKASSPAGTSS